MRFTKVLVFGSALAAVLAAAVISVGAQESRRGRAIIKKLIASTGGEASLA